ncbi:unnamed protein product, partial [Trichogramma brassicae]
MKDEDEESDNEEEDPLLLKKMITLNQLFQTIQTASNSEPRDSNDVKCGVQITLKCINERMIGTGNKRHRDIVTELLIFELSAGAGGITGGDTTSSRVRWRSSIQLPDALASGSFARCEDAADSADSDGITFSGEGPTLDLLMQLTVALRSPRGRYRGRHVCFSLALKVHRLTSQCRTTHNLKMESATSSQEREAVFQDPNTKWAYSDEKWHRGCYYLYHNYRDWSILKNNVPCITFHNVFMEHQWLSAISVHSDRVNENAKSIRKHMLKDGDTHFFYKSLQIIQSLHQADTLPRLTRKRAREVKGSLAKFDLLVSTDSLSPINKNTLKVTDNLICRKIIFCLEGGIVAGNVILSSAIHHMLITLLQRFSFHDAGVCKGTV